MSVNDVFGGEGIGIHAIDLLDAFGHSVGKLRLEQPILVGSADRIALDFVFTPGGSTVKMDVICPECRRNPLANTSEDYVCRVCREVINSA
jgi:hypothetical protein